MTRIYSKTEIRNGKSKASVKEHALHALVFILVSSNAFALWETLNTEHFTVFYKHGYESQAQEFLKTLEYHRLKVENLTHNNAFHVPRDFEILKDSSIIYSKDKKDSFGSEIIKYDINSKEKKKLFDSEYLVDRIVSDGDRIIVSARKDWENFNIYVLDLDKQQLT